MARLPRAAPHSTPAYLTHSRGLGGALRGRMVVFPARRLRKRHQDRLDAAACLQSKDRAAVIHQVELDISSAAHELPLLLLLCESVILVLRDDWQVRGDKSIKAILGEGEDFLRLTIVLVIEEDAAEASRLAAVLNGEVLIRPLLELGVVLRVVLVADVLVCRRDVRTTAKPPRPAIGLKVAVVEVHGGRHRVARVHHAGQAARKERHALALGIALRTVGAARCCRLQSVLRHGAVHDGKRASCLLKDIAVGEHTRDATTPARTSPHVLFERRAIQLAYRVADVVLRPPAILLEAATHVHVGTGHVVIAH
eukprot:scaffold14030_cov121-Isochrysis_galbana.AAC.7